MELACLA
ncbi:hypothetical protein YPPY25_1878, partial [Yersinia pestis PY-25]